MSQKINTSLKEIDRIYAEAIGKLKEFHRRKMALIARYCTVGEEKTIEDIRKNIRKS